MKIRLSLLLFSGTACAVVNGADHPAFEVLQNNCIECHNAHDHEGEIVLDRAPLRPEGLKLVLQAVSGPEPEMPPKRDPLNKEQIEALKNWIESGAAIPEGRILKNTRVADRNWWSLRPVVEAEVPPSETGWPRNPIDHFVEARRSEAGLSPAPEASLLTLVRRLTYDLTGLPPTPGEVRDFLHAAAVDREKAYLDLVERLLGSPRYGEQWGRRWLDLVRYGESHGYDKDKARFHAWPYRDYVIRSFNEDKPWSRFVQEQVAGDVLWPGRPEGIVALGFVAAGPWDFIAHVEVGEGKRDGRIAKHLDRDDMVSAVFNVFMSTTVQCAQCHQHKFDPVSMEDYYRLQAVFAGVDRADRAYQPDEAVAGKRVSLNEEIVVIDQEIRKLTKEREERGGRPLAEARKRVVALAEAVGKGIKTVPEHGYHSGLAGKESEGKWVQVDLGVEKELREIRLVACHDDFGGIGAGFGFPLRFRIESAENEDFTRGRKVLVDRTGEDFANPGLTPVSFPLDPPVGAVRFVRVTATRLARRKDVFIFSLGELELLDHKGKNQARGIKVTAKDTIDAPPRWRPANLVDGRFAVVSDPSSNDALAKARHQLAQILAETERVGEQDRLKSLKETRQVLQGRLDNLPKDKVVYSLASDFKAQGKFVPTNGRVRPIHLLHRGDLSSPGEIMAPSAPALWDGVASEFELADDAPEGERRAALARYLTDPDNPLIWRSAVNRIWQWHFGRGIVASPNDFGRMGLKPSHPGLLDWLAVRFREKQSLKDLHRLIVTSATYRQASSHHSRHAEVDGSNVFHWRMNRRKLRAEEIRDAMLATSGALELRMGGPSFHDFRFKDDHTPKYQYHLHDPNDPASHRRTVYRFIARSQTQPFLTTLDCADPSQMVANRDETVTSLQALALMNNPLVESMSAKLAQRAGNVEKAFWLALGRAPAPEELKELERYAGRHGLPAAARLIFNLNEFAYVD